MWGTHDERVAGAGGGPHVLPEGELGWKTGSCSSAGSLLPDAPLDALGLSQRLLAIRLSEGSRLQGGPESHHSVSALSPDTPGGTPGPSPLRELRANTPLEGGVQTKGTRPHPHPADPAPKVTQSSPSSQLSSKRTLRKQRHPGPRVSLLSHFKQVCRWYLAQKVARDRHKSGGEGKKTPHLLSLNKAASKYSPSCWRQGEAPTGSLSPSPAP